jgi:hypothetical protein
MIVWMSASAIIYETGILAALVIIVVQCSPKCRAASYHRRRHAIPRTMWSNQRMLTRAQKDELEQQGAQNIRFKLASYGGGRGAAIGGFRCGDISRGEIEDWLAEKYQREAAQQCSTLRWARIAALAATVSAILSAIAVWLVLVGRNSG